MARTSVKSDLLVKVIDKLVLRRWTLALAESCTGGLLSSRLAERPGVSRVFLGACVCYSNFSKEKLLKVPKDLIKSHGAVSSHVALAMAANVRKSLKSTWALSITGIAGPGGGSKYKPVGTVYFGISGPNVEGFKKVIFKGERKDVQIQATEFALELLFEMFNHRRNKDK